MELITNEVVISIVLLLVLSLLRVNVILSLLLSALTCGMLGNFRKGEGLLVEGLQQTLKLFVNGLGGGAETAMNYALLGAFAVALSKSGLTDWLAQKVIALLGKNPKKGAVLWFKYGLMLTIVGLSMASQNIIPIHIAFIPIVLPPLLGVLNQLHIDRRGVACAITFGLTATYMIVPVGFGQIFIESILVRNINEVGRNMGFVVTAEQMVQAMLLPVIGMVIGLLVALFISYRKPRVYEVVSSENIISEEKITNLVQQPIRKKPLIVGVVAIVVTCSVQLGLNSAIMGALAGLILFALGGVFRLKESNDVVDKGLHLMAMIGFVMIAASGFANVVNATGGIGLLVENVEQLIGTSNKGLAAFLMLVVGLFITMGIGSSFSTVPIIASIYVPLCLSFKFSPMATLVILGVSAALGDAGSPASDSTLGPTSGLNADGKHDHIWDSVVPTFLHFNLPLLLFGWIAAMIL